jgi:hypothetical protein
MKPRLTPEERKKRQSLSAAKYRAKEEVRAYQANYQAKRTAEVRAALAAWRANK